jgi:hypothetical protein
MLSRSSPSVGHVETVHFTGDHRTAGDATGGCGGAVSADGGGGSDGDRDGGAPVSVQTREVREPMARCASADDYDAGDDAEGKNKGDGVCCTDGKEV